MKNIILSALLVLVSTLLFAQENLENIDSALVNEGKTLYRIEKALEIGREVYRAKHKGWDSVSTGSFSYPINNNLSRFVLYNKKSLSVGYTITFDSTFTINSSGLDSTKRNFTFYEKNIYKINAKANEIIKDTAFFIRYDYTDFILIPIINESIKKIYVFTHYTDTNVMWLNYNYVLTFDGHNNLTGKKQLPHCTYCDSITSADICIVMLYEKKARWKTYSFISDNYEAIWDCTLNRFVDIRNIRCDGFFSQFSNGWKNDSLRTNGFRWLMGYYLLNEGTCTFIGRPINEVINWLGRPDRIDTGNSDFDYISDKVPKTKIATSNSIMYTYQYYLSPFSPSSPTPYSSGFQILKIFVLCADLKVFDISIYTWGRGKRE